MAMDSSGAQKNYSQSKAALMGFTMRSPKRDAEVDQARIGSIVNAIDKATEDVVAERTGLIERVKALVDQKQAIVKRNVWQRKASANLSTGEFFRAEQRLKILGQQILDFECLKAEISQRDALRRIDIQDSRII